VPDDGIDYHNQHRQGVTPDKDPDIAVISSENYDRKPIIYSYKPDTGKQELKRYMWHCTCNGGYEKPEQIQYNGIGYRMIEDLAVNHSGLNGTVD
jgi:hypothetical protein